MTMRIDADEFRGLSKTDFELIGIGVRENVQLAM